MVVEMTGALDMWTLFVEYVFGGFWMAVIGIMVTLFIITGILGRISIYTVMWYCIMFLLAMGLGYGYTTLNIFITGALLVAVYLAGKNYFEKG